MKYHTIYADPPWMERGGGKIKRGADRHYPLMSTKDIMALDVPSIAADDCHLYLWVTNNFLPDGLKVMEAWGFRYVTMITWLKDRAGLGQYFRASPRATSLGSRGTRPTKSAQMGSAVRGSQDSPPRAPSTVESRRRCVA